MHKAMVFIDYENFEIARSNLYKKESGSSQWVPWIDLVEFPKKVIDLLNNDFCLMKTFLFAPKPDEVLKGDIARTKRYEFLKGLENTNYFSVIFGRHVARPIDGDHSSIDITKKSTYFVTEKGTDINVAVEMLKKAYHNSYDTAIVVSGDTDYLPIYDTLNSMGKAVVVVAVKGQNLSKIKTHTDRQVLLDLDFFLNCENKKPAHSASAQEDQLENIDNTEACSPLELD